MQGFRRSRLAVRRDQERRGLGSSDSQKGHTFSVGVVVGRSTGAARFVLSGAHLQECCGAQSVSSEHWP